MPALIDVGVRSGRVCGVHDYSRALATELVRSGWHVEHVWWSDDEDASVRSRFRSLRRWGRLIRRRSRQVVPDVVLWHYSVFSYGWRGVPLLAPWFARRLGGLGFPVIVVLHEFAYPWGRRGWRGFITAVTQRLALIPLLKSVTGAVVTTDKRLQWLTRKWWIPRRPVVLSPVFATVPRPTSGPTGPGNGVGVFGWAVEGARVELVVAAAARLKQDGLLDQLVLVGGSEAEGAAGARWRCAAERAGRPDLIRCTGFLGERELTETIASLAVVLIPDMDGAASRKTTIAAGLALGRSLVAFKGPDEWDAMAFNQAVSIVAPDLEALTERVRTLICDEEARRVQGQRGSQFYDQHMDIARTAERIRELTDVVVAEARQPKGH